MQGTEHNSLLIGGLDPTGGAGILADHSVCQKMGVKPFTILTTDTIQSNDRFYAIRWSHPEWIKEQLRLILKSNIIQVAKIGIIENPAVLYMVVEMLKAANPQIKIVWDPIRASTSGQTFYPWRIKDVDAFLSDIYLITPNKKEFLQLTSGVDEALQFIRAHTHVLIKSYDIDSVEVTDILFTSSASHRYTYPLHPHHQQVRGTGCRLASGILCALLKKHELQEACSIAGKALQEYKQSIQELKQQVT